MRKQNNNIQNTLLENPFFKSTQLYKNFWSDPLVFSDIGARGGPSKLLNVIAPLTKIIAFEPAIEEHPNIINTFKNQNFRKFEIHNTAISGKTEERAFYQTKNPNCSSLYEVLESFKTSYGGEGYELVKKSSMKTKSLNDICKENDYRFDILKIDVQGAELEILKGASKVINPFMSAIILEVSFLQSYENQCSFGDINSFLRDNCYQFVGLLDATQKSTKSINKYNELGRERLFEADALFIKDLNKVNKYSTRTILGVIMACIITEFFDLAIEISSKFLEIEESKKINSFIKEEAKSRFKKIENKIKSKILGADLKRKNCLNMLSSIFDEMRFYNDFKNF